MKLYDFEEHYDRKSIVQLEGRSSWIRIRSGDNSVEGKLQRPEFGSQKLIIFEPGFPGDGSTRLERLWLDSLLKNNFTVFTIRHNGTIVNGKHSATYLNCPEKQERAREDKQLLLARSLIRSVTG